MRKTRTAIYVALILFALFQTFIYWPASFFTWIIVIIYTIYMLEKRKKEKDQGEG